MPAFVTVLLYVIGLLSFIGSVVFVWRGGASANGAVMVAVGAFAILLTRLPDITKFGALGMTTELQRTINEANATITQLRALALTIAEPELSQLAMSGVILSELPFSHQYQRKKQIVESLKTLGIPQGDITRAEKAWTAITLLKLSNVIALELDKTDRTLAEKFRTVRTAGDFVPAKPQVLHDFLSENHVTSNEALALVADYEHLYQTGEVRRPEVFPIGINP